MGKESGRGRKVPGHGGAHSGHRVQPGRHCENLSQENKRDKKAKPLNWDSSHNQKKNIVIECGQVDISHFLCPFSEVIKVG